MLLRRRDRLFHRFRRTGDAWALGRVFDLTANELLHVAVHLAGDRATAEDLVQSTFLEAIQFASRCEPGRPVLPWLLGILANHARRQRRTAQRSPTVESIERAGGTSPVEEASRAELRAALKQALDALPEPLRQILVLHLEHGLSAREIGEALGRPAGTVRTYVVRGLQRLRRLLPAGVASAGALAAEHAAPVRGLAAVRQEVVAFAAQSGMVPAGAGAVSLAATGVFAGGVVVTKKLVLAVALVALVWLGWDAVTGSRAAAGPASGMVSVPAPKPAATDTHPTSRQPIAHRHEREQGAGALRILVRRPDQTPVVGTRVLVVADREEAWLGPPLLDQGTDAAGVVVLDPALGSLLVLTAHGLLRQVGVAEGQPALLEIEVPAGVTVEGDVVADYLDPRPVAGARVYCTDKGVGEFHPQLLAVTDAHGRFVVRDLQDSRRQLWAEASGYAPSRVADVFGRPGSTLRLQLVFPGPGHRLAGQVVEESGAPSPHAWVGVALADRDYPGQPLSRYDTRSVLADAEGRFVVDWVPPGEHLLLARPRPAALSGRALLPLRVTAGEPASARLVLRQLPRISGTVRDARGLPVAAQQIQVWDTGASLGNLGRWLVRPPETRTAADGTYQIPGLLPWRYHLQVGVNAQAAATDVEPRPGEELAWNPTLRDAVDHRIRVVDPDGRPCAGWKVVWWKPAPDNRHPVTSATTDGEGRAFAAKLDPELGYRVLAHGVLRPVPLGSDKHDPFPSVVLEDVRPGGPETEVVVPRERMPSVRLKGRVLGADGLPASAASVGWGRKDARGQGYDHHGTVAVEDGSGVFDLGPLAPGVFTLHVVASGCNAPRLSPRAAGAGETVDFGDIRSPALSYLDVDWRTPDGTLPMDARIWLREANGSFSDGWMERVGRAPRFRSQSLSEGTVELYARVEGCVPVRRVVTLAAGRTEQLEVRSVPGVETSFTLAFAGSGPHASWSVLDATGAPVLEELVFAPSKEPREVQRRTWLLPGRYRTRLHTPGAEPGDLVEFEVGERPGEVVRAVAR